MGKYATAVLGGTQEEKAPRKYASKILGGDPDIAPEQQGFSGRLPLDPNIAQRGQILPLGRTQEGGLELAIPQIGIDIAESAMMPGRAAQGEPTSMKDWTEFALDFAIPALRGPAGTKMRMKAGKAITPSAQELKGQAGKIYDEIETSGIKVRPEGFRAMFEDLTMRIKDRGFHPKMHPKAAGAMEAIGDYVGKTLNMQDMGIVRRLAKSAKNSIDPDEARIGREILGHIDTSMRQLPGVGEKYARADKLWSMGKKSELLDKAVLAAKATASGFENGLRIEFRKLLKKSREGRLQLSPQETSAMQKVVDGSVPTNLMKGLGKLGPAPGGAGNALLAVIAGSGGYALGGLPGAAAVVGGGYGARRGAQALTGRAAERARGVVAGARPQMRQVPVGAQGLGRAALGQVPGMIGRTEAMTPRTYGGAPVEPIPREMRPGLGEMTDDEREQWIINRRLLAAGGA